MMKGMPWAWSRSAVALMLAMETGCPPDALLVTVIMPRGMRSTPTSLMSCASLSRSMLPLKSASASGSVPDSGMRSMASARVYSMLARVVSKWVLLGTMSPSLVVTEKRMRSAARPWWVGMTCLNPVISRIFSSNWK